MNCLNSVHSLVRFIAEEVTELMVWEIFKKLAHLMKCLQVCEHGKNSSSSLHAVEHQVAPYLKGSSFQVDFPFHSRAELRSYSFKGVLEFIPKY